MELGSLSLSLSQRGSGGAAAFTPASISGLEAWYDAQDLATITKASNKISQGADKSGHARHMLQATGANQPTYVASGINSLPSVSFTGSPVFMEASVPAGTFTGGLHWYFVFQKVGADQGFEALMTRCVPTHSPAPVDGYNASRFFYQQGLATSGVSLATQTTPIILEQSADVGRSWLEEWSNGRSVLAVGGALQTGQDTSGVLTLATRDDRFTSGRFYLGEVLAYSRPLSASERALVSAYLSTKWAISLTPPANSINIIGHGDSITKGTVNSLTAPWFKTLVDGVSLTAPGVAYSHNRGIDGQGWGYVWPSSGVAVNLTADAPANVDAARIAGIRNYLTLCAGTNDIVLDSKTGAQTYAKFQTYIQARLAAGWNASDIFVATMLPRNSVETERTAYNAALVAGAATYGYNLVRLDLNSHVGVAGANTNTTYYNVDQIHPNNTGMAEIKAEFAAVMFP